MISFGPMVRVFVATQPIDFRKGVHGLVALVAEGLGGKPYSGDVYVFRSKRSDRLKLLVFDGSGMVLATSGCAPGRGILPKNGGKLLGAFLNLRSIGAMRGRSWFWGAFLSAV